MSQSNITLRLSSLDLNATPEKAPDLPDDALPSDAPANADPNAVDSSKQADVSAGDSGPMLSPSSLKNPRMRKFSMGVEEEKEELEEVAEEEAEDEYYVKYKNL